MSKLKATDTKVLHQWFVELNDKPVIIKRFDIVELDELVDYLDVLIFQRFEYIDKLLIANYGNANITLEWAINNVSQYGCSYNRLIQLKEFVLSRINELKGIQELNSLIFGYNIQSQNFFNFVVNNWIINDKSKKTSIAYLYRMMHIDTLKEDKLEGLEFEIVCGSTQFAKFWNTNFSNIYAFENTKQPKLKNLNNITSGRYKIEMLKQLKIFKSL